MHLELTDDNGAIVPATVTDIFDANGAVVGKQVKLTVAFGDEFFVHVSGTNANALPKLAADSSSLPRDLRASPRLP